MRSLCRRGCRTLSERGEVYVVVDACNDSAHIDECCSYLALSEVALAYFYNDINSRYIFHSPIFPKVMGFFIKLP